MKQSTPFAQVATNFLNVLQGYTKGIRFVVVLTMLLIVGIGQVWGAEVFKETFKKSTGTAGFSGNAGNGTFVADNTGWTTQNPYGAGGAAKFGASKKIGEAETPSINCGIGVTSATLTFKSGAWSGDAKTLKLSYTNCSGAATVALKDAQWSEYTVELTNITGNIKIKFTGNATSSARFFLDDVVVSTTDAPTTYTVTYNKNGATSGTVPTDDTNYTSGTTVTVKHNSGTLAKTGYTFGGWNTKSDGTGTNYTAGSGTFKITGNTTLYAKWTAKQSTITINPNTTNHGTGSNVSVTATYGQALPSFAACTPATGYELVGYYTSATGGTKVIATDGKLVASVSGYTDANAKWINESASLTLYAQYSAINYSVQYNGNSGTTSCTGGTYTYNSSFAICSDKPTRTGYSFTGWSDGTNTYQPGANYTMPAKNVTFTAQWQINTYKVKWNVDGSETEVDVNYNSKPTGAPTIDPNNLPCEGADKFVGWTDAENGNYTHGTSKLYQTIGEIPAITGNITFYAVFADYANE